jgi:tetratricopeptide (TPR) repeat protein
LFRDNSLLEFDPFSKHFLSVLFFSPNALANQCRVLQEALARTGRLNGGIGHSTPRKNWRQLMKRLGQTHFVSLSWVFSILASMLLMQDRSTAQSACAQLGVDCNWRTSGGPGAGHEDQEAARELAKRHELSTDANRSGVEAYRAGHYKDAVTYFKQALKYEPWTLYSLTHRKYTDLVRRNLRDAETALKAQRKGAGDLLLFEGTRSAATDANHKGMAAYRAGRYEEAINYFREALKYDPQHVDQKNLKMAQAALNVQLKAESKATEVARKQAAEVARKEGQERKREADVAKNEEKKRKQEEVALAKRYSALPEPPSPRPLRVPDLMDRIKTALSDDLDRVAAFARNGGSTLPQPTTQGISDTIFRYVSEHGIPNEYAQTYWTINKGAADDINAVFDAIRKDLAERGALGSNTEKALDTFETNLRSRISNAGKDAAVTASNKL